jgi:hypothetical protein
MKHLCNRSAIASLGLLCAFNTYADCNIVGASYNITRGDSVTQVEMWRDNNRVAWVYPNSEITEMWEQSPHSGPKLTRYYDAHQHAIEYQPEESDRKGGHIAFEMAASQCSVVEQLVLKAGDKRTEWTLTATHRDATAAQRVFSVRESYKSTDFADIGDNETDPFLRDMIHLGFSDGHNH